MYAAKAPTAPVLTARGTKRALDAIAKIGHTNTEALRAPDSDLHPTALRQAYLIVRAYQGADIGECAAELKRPISAAKVLLAYGEQRLLNSHSLVTRYTRELCMACDVDFAALQKRACK